MPASSFLYHMMPHNGSLAFPYTVPSYWRGATCELNGNLPIEKPDCSSTSELGKLRCYTQWKKTLFIQQLESQFNIFWIIFGLRVLPLFWISTNTKFTVHPKCKVIGQTGVSWNTLLVKNTSSVCSGRCFFPVMTKRWHRAPAKFRRSLIACPLTFRTHLV